MTMTTLPEYTALDYLMGNVPQEELNKWNEELAAEKKEYERSETIARIERNGRDITEMNIDTIEDFHNHSWFV